MTKSPTGPRSMTGFGSGLLTREGFELRVEIRSVNHRGLSVRMGLPTEFSHHEPAIEARVRSTLTRGSVQLTLHSQRLGNEAPVDIDEELVERYADQLRDLALRSKLEPPELATILSLPGAVRARKKDAPEEAHVIQVVDEALEAVQSSRAREGAQLVTALLEIVADLERSVETIETRWPDVVRRYGERLEKRIEDYLTKRGHACESSDVIREVAIWADKADVAEEVLRFRAHLEEMRRLLASGETLGRRLEFLGQELLREANTMAAKSSDAELAHEVVEIKAALDRIREQGQNLE